MKVMKTESFGNRVLLSMNNTLQIVIRQHHLAQHFMPLKIPPTQDASGDDCLLSAMVMTTSVALVGATTGGVPLERWLSALAARLCSVCVVEMVLRTVPVMRSSSSSVRTDAKWKASGRDENI